MLGSIDSLARLTRDAAPPFLHAPVIPSVALPARLTRCLYMHRCELMNVIEMSETAERVSDLMKVLSSPKRLMILCQLVGAQRSVGELARLLDMRAAAVSQQLSLLRREDIVAARREGQTIFYSLARDDVRLLIAFLYDTYCAPQSDPADGAGEETP